MQYIMVSLVKEARTNFPSSDFFIRRVIGVIVLLSRFLSNTLLMAVMLNYQLWHSYKRGAILIYRIVECTRYKLPVESGSIKSDATSGDDITGNLNKYVDYIATESEIGKTQ